MRRFVMLTALLSSLIAGAIGAAYAPGPADLKEARSEARAEEDLAAQQEVARWAFPMLLITGASVLVSVAALYGLFSSLSQTREAIKDNRELGEAQIRAYVEAEGVRFAGDAQALVVDLLNMGQTPVMSFDITAEILSVPEGKITENVRLPNGKKKSFDGIGCGVHARRPVRIVPSSGGELIVRFVSNVPPPQRRCLVVGRIDYRDIFDKEWTTGFAFYFDGGSFLEPFHTLPTYRATKTIAHNAAEPSNPA